MHGWEDEGRAGDIHAEIRDRFGLLPNFFRLTSESPEVTTALWGFARFAYLDNPLPSLFKERLFVYLSRFCEVRYCISRHVGFLIGLGRPAGDAQSPVQTIDEIVQLVSHPLPRNEHIQPYAAQCAACAEPLAKLPEPDSSMEEAIFACATHAFLQTPQAPICLAGLKRALGASLFERLLVFLAFVRTAHYWTKVHTELEIEQDIKDLLATHEVLAECVLNDPEGGAPDVNRQLIDELALLREAQRRLSAEAQKHYERAQLSQQEAEVAHSDLAMLGKRLQIITDAVPVLIAYVDRHERHRFASKAFENWFGISPERMLGKSMREIVGEATYAAIRPHVEQALSGEEVSFDFHWGFGSSPPRWLRAIYVPQRNPNGEVDGFVALVLDISAQKQADAASEALVSNLERTVTFSERFVGILGHDLRNPLFAIHTAGLVLGQRAKTTSDLKTSQRIISSAERMSRMITELLDFTRTRIGSGIPLSPTRSDLASICASVVEELETAHPEAAITVDRQGDTAGTWDQDRLAQVFSNILGNALDHGVDSATAIRLDGTASDAIAVEVRNGGAIPADRLPTIFDPFLQATRTDPRAGLGLGLYIAAQIVHAHGGSIEASTADDTTLFRIVIPRDAPSTAHVFAEGVPDHSLPA